MKPIWKKIVVGVCCVSLIGAVTLKPVQVRATAVAVPTGAELLEVIAGLLAALGVGISVDSYLTVDTDGTSAVDEDKVDELYNDLKIAYDAQKSQNGEDPDPDEFDNLVGHVFIEQRVADLAGDDR